jgi:hypothetical protein
MSSKVFNFFLSKYAYLEDGKYLWYEKFKNLREKMAIAKKKHRSTDKRREKMSMLHKA